MPIYLYRCPTCSIEEEVILPIDNRDDARLHCNTVMIRVMTLPQSPIMKQTAGDMALDSLNHDCLSPHEKGIGIEKAVMQGFERNRPLQFTGF